MNESQQITMDEPSCSNSLRTKSSDGFRIADDDIFVDIVDDIDGEDEGSIVHNRHRSVRKELRRGVFPVEIGASTSEPSTKISKVIVDDNRLTEPLILNSSYGYSDGDLCEMMEDEIFNSYAFTEQQNEDYGFQSSSSYQVLEHYPQNYFVCDLCESRPVFFSRGVLNTHRYRVHGNMVSVCACPCPECECVFASIGAVKRHLTVDHKLPLESHYKKFDNILDFNDWIIFIQYATNTRFVMHNRQQPKRRQLLFCTFSDHRKSNNKPTGMIKSKGCCPAHLNYSVNENGSVEVIYQMFHCGHSEKAFDDLMQTKPWSLERSLHNLFAAKSESRKSQPHRLSTETVNCRQSTDALCIDIIEMTEAKYRQDTKYSNILIVTDMFSKFMFGRSLIENEEAEQERVVTRLLMEIFCAFGLPEGYSSFYGNATIDACMCQISQNFRVVIPPITTITPCYAALRKKIELRAENELGDKLRWPESLPFTILSHNQTPHTLFQCRISPFEMMFGRRAWYSSHPDNELPWLCASNEENFGHSNQRGAQQRTPCEVRQHDPSVSILDAAGKPLVEPLVSKMKRIISIDFKIESRCERWEEQSLAVMDVECSAAYRRFGVKQAFVPNDYVYVRGLNTTCEKSGYLKGLVAEVRLESGSHFPYHVHVQRVQKDNLSTNDSFTRLCADDLNWPTLEDEAFWVSAYDVCTISLEQGVKRQPQFDAKFESLYCTCMENCALFKSDHCANSMSKQCCSASAAAEKCVYHCCYNPLNVPVDRFVKTYSQNPEQVLKRIISQKALQNFDSGKTSIIEGKNFHNQIEPLPHSANPTNNKNESKSNKEQFISSSTVIQTDVGTEKIISDEQTSNLSTREAENVDDRKVAEVFETSDRCKLAALESEIDYIEKKLAKGNPLDEDSLMFESKIVILKKKRDGLRKQIDFNEKQMKLRQAFGVNLPSSSSISAGSGRKKFPRIRYSPEVTETRQHARLVVEDNQVFPIISLIPLNSSGTGPDSIEEPCDAEPTPAIRPNRGILRRKVVQKNMFSIRR